MDGLIRDDDGLVIDGSVGEGGGQILRTALGLSVATGRPFRMHRIRAGRSRPGLLRQHATSVAAAAAISDAEVVGGEVGSESLVFTPRAPKAGRYEFSVGTAGSTALVLHAILPGLLAARGESEVVLCGGTDNPSAPPFDHLAEVTVPLLRAMGVAADVTLERRGYYPAGGGRLRVRVRGGSLAPIDRLVRGALDSVEVVARVTHGLSPAIARRELGAMAAHLAELGIEPRLTTDSVESAGPGNTLGAILRHRTGASVFTAFGEKRVTSEQVADELAGEVRRFLAVDAAVDEYTADQLVLLLALAGGGAFTTTAPSQHTRTQLALIPAFVDVGFRVASESGVTRIDVVGR